MNPVLYASSDAIESFLLSVQPKSLLIYFYAFPNFEETENVI